MGGHGPILHPSTPFGVDHGGCLVHFRLKPTATHGVALRATLGVILFSCVLGDANAQSEPADWPAQVQAQAPRNATPGESRTVSWKRLVPNLVDDQRKI